MRNPKRIKPILKTIEKIWLTQPDLRLMQLLGNCWDHGFDPYHVEDDKLEKILRQVYNMYNK